MKKSEMRQRFRERLLDDSRAEAALQTMEGAGYTWEPEEEPMAERLLPTPSWGHFTDTGGRGIPTWWVVDESGGLRKRDAHAAADLYNRRKDIAEIAKDLRGFAEGFDQSDGVRVRAGVFLRFADRLEGKEKP